MSDATYLIGLTIVSVPAYLAAIFGFLNSRDLNRVKASVDGILEARVSSAEQVAGLQGHAAGVIQGESDAAARAEKG